MDAVDAAAYTVLHDALYLTIRDDSNNSTGNSTSSSDSTTSTGRPPIYKVVGICLAVTSGLFIGVSFVIKKKGLLKANVKYNEEAGEGYGYLKNAWWWTGMTLMILGEICNFVAYAFTDAILVTPLGALSVVVTTILSSTFLKERLSFVGWVSCAICIIGSVVIVLNAPEQAAVKDIQEMQHYVIAPGFLSYAGVIIVGCVCVVFFVAPRYGKKSMLVYLTICSLIGGLSVVATQGLGSAILAQINGESQFTHWFLYVLLAFVICTLLTEIIYLNKALNIFNAALVTPTYYVYFTSSTIVASAVLFQGFHGTVTQIIDVVLGFLVICSGVVLLQLAKSAKDVPDSAVFKGDLDQIRTVAEQEEPEYEPRADTLRSGASIVRAISRVRTKRQADEAKRIHQDRLEPVRDGDEFEWDGLRRRRTMSSAPVGTVKRAKTVHPPLGMSHFPSADEEAENDEHHGFFTRMGRKCANSVPSPRVRNEHSPVPLETVDVNKMGPQPAGNPIQFGLSPSLRQVDDHEDTSYRGGQGHVHFASTVNDNGKSRDFSYSSKGSSLAVPEPPPHSPGGQSGNRRQFSFQNVFHRKHHEDSSDRPGSRGALSFISAGSGGGRRDHSYPGTSGDGATEEERLGLVHGDSSRTMQRQSILGESALVAEPEEDPDSVEWQVTSGTSSSPHDLAASTGDLARQRRGADERYDYDRDDEDEDDDLYNEPLQTPKEYYGQGGGQWI